MRNARLNSAKAPTTVPQVRQTLSAKFRTGSTSSLNKLSIGGIKKTQSTASLKSLPKKRTDIATTAKLERVLGSTACSSSISVDPTAGLVAYPASSTVVVQNPRAQAQAHFISSSKNNITCLAFSPNGRYLVTGEYGNEPMVRVWEIHKDGQKDNFGQQIVELKGHSFGISCVRFTADSNQVISVGNQHDKSITVWDWRNSRTMAESRVSSQVNAMDLNENGKVIVTVGSRHVKFWHLDTENKVLQGRSAILAENRNNTFVDVCSAPNNRTFTITVTKLLLELHDKKLVGTYELHGEIPRSICMGNSLLYMGFNNGTIRALNPDNIEQFKVMPKPHNLKIELCDANPDETFEVQYPDVHSIVFHEKTNTLTAFYSDRSIYHWQVAENDEVYKLTSHLFHVGTVYDVEVVNSNSPYFPAGTFFTAGADETVRVWNVEKEQRDGILPTNSFSFELRKIVYLGAAGCESLTEQPDKNFGAIASDMLEATSGIRCLKLNHLGEHLAVGSKNGNVCVLDIRTPEMSKIWECEAHDNEVRCLEYTDPRKCDGRHYLATGSRDRLIHIFDANNDYSHLTIIDDHQSSVYRILFMPSPTGLEMVTCSNDKLIVVRKLNPDSDGGPTFHRVKQLNVTGGPNYVVTTPENNLMAACADRKLHLYSLNGKLIKSVKGTLCEEGNLTKLVLDPSGTYAATICSDRYVYVIDVATGECAAVLSGQSDTVASVTFTADCRRLILVSFSGCVFVWRLSNLLTKRMLAKLDQDRSTTPDSLIESGSDSASAVASKKEHHGSEFGSLNSLNVAQDDDLDSGVGLRQPNPCQVKSDQNQTFSISRVPTEVVRRSTSNLAATSSGDLRQEADQFGMYQNAGVSVISQPVPPQGYTTSRSMSNIHRSAVSPQRQRRRWNVPPNETFDPSQTYNYSNGTLPFPTQQNSIYAQPQVPQQQQFSSPVSRFAQMPASMSMNGIRSALPPEESYLMASTPNGSPYSQQQMIDAQFDRNHRSRNSISKRYLNGVENAEGMTVWKPSQLKQRRPSNLFSPTRQSNLSPRRQSLTSSSSRSSSSRMYQPRLSQPPNINESPSRLASRVFKQRRQTEQDESSMSNMTAAETLRALRSRSQSPSTLALQLAEQQSRKISATLQRRRDSDARSGRATPSSSRANLRTQSNLGNSSQALNKLTEMRDQLKKSQDNLLMAADGMIDPASPTSEGIMARSRSIGNLRINAPRPTNVDDGYYGSQRQMTRSVSSLHNTSTSPNSSDSPHPDENNLRSQYGNERRRSAMTASVRNLHKMSNPDLADDVFEQEDKVNMNNSNGAYYSATLPKNLRKGAVQKRLERSNPRVFNRLDQQTTSGDSDSNASDATPYSSIQQRAQLFQQRATPNGTQFRSVSSVAASPRGIIQRKGGNYLSRLNQPEEQRELEEKNPILELNDVDGVSANAKNMSLHAQECILQMTTCCDKLIQASQMIEKDGSITDVEREKILRPIYKAINQFKNRLETALPEGRTFSDMTNVTNAESGSFKGSGRPSNISNGSSHQTQHTNLNQSAPVEINDDFFKTHGAKLMQFMQEKYAAGSN